MPVVVVDVAPDFLRAKFGDIVVIEEDSPLFEADNLDWWVGRVIHAVGGARDPLPSSLFQVACIDTGIIRTVNADAVKGVLRPRELDL